VVENILGLGVVLSAMLLALTEAAYEPKIVDTLLPFITFVYAATLLVSPVRKATVVLTKQSQSECCQGLWPPLQVLTASLCLLWGCWWTAIGRSKYMLHHTGRVLKQEGSLHKGNRLRQAYLSLYGAVERGYSVSWECLCGCDHRNHGCLWESSDHLSNIAMQHGHEQKQNWQNSVHTGGGAAGEMGTVVFEGTGKVELAAGFASTVGEGVMAEMVGEGVGAGAAVMVGDPAATAGAGVGAWAAVMVADAAATVGAGVGAGAAVMVGDAAATAGAGEGLWPAGK